MGGVREVVLQKTGVLTEGKELKVTKFFAEGQLIENVVVNTLAQSELGISKELIKESIAANCFTCRVEMDDDAVYRPKGTLLDSCLIKFLMSNDIDAHTAMKDAESRLLEIIPFSAFRMLSTTVLRMPENKVRVYTKGAPEFIIPMCTSYFDLKASTQKLTETQKQVLLNEFCVELIAQEGEKPIAFAFRDMTLEEYEKLKSSLTTTEAKSQAFETDMVFLSLFSFQDELRSNLSEVISKSIEGNLKIRLVTSDNVGTATELAIRSGFLTIAQSKRPNVVMDGAEFLRRVGGIKKIKDNFGDIIGEEIVNQPEFDTIVKKLRVLGRCTPDAKYLLIAGLKK